MSTSTATQNGAIETPEPRVTLDGAMSRALRLLCRINRLEPLSGSAPREFEIELQSLEREIVKLCQGRSGTSTSGPRGAAPSSARFRQSLVACDVALRMQTAEIAGFLATVCGKSPDAGVYHPSAGRRSSPGAWMSMRSSP